MDYVNKIRKYDRERKQKKNTDSLQDPLSYTPVKEPSYYSVLKKSKECQNILGHSPKTHTTVLKHIMKKACKSPRKAECLNQSPFKLTPSRKFETPPNPGSVTKALRKMAVLKSKRNYAKAQKLADHLLTQFGTVKNLSSHTGDDERALYRLMSPPKFRKKEEYIRKLSPEVKDEVERIYKDVEVSYALPDMKFAGLLFMSCTIGEAHRIYLKKCQTKRKVAEKTFAAMKPKYVKTIQETPLRGCTCDYCENFGKLRETLIGLGIKGIPRNHAASIEKTLCPFRRDLTDEMDIRNFVVRDELPGKKCVQRSCPNCGVKPYQLQIIEENREKIRKLKQVTWQQWGSVNYRAEDGKLKSKMALITYNGSVTKLLTEYFKRLKSIALHQFNKIWQLRNFNLTLRNLQRGQVLFVHDFQMNMILFAQDEPASTHWDHNQLTIHPTVAFYRCPNNECNEMVREDIIHITDDKHHTKHAVNAFVAKSISHLQSKGVPILEVIEFTDQASGQYKSKFTFHNKTKFDFPYTRHYYGVKHGKGPSDRSGGRFKKFLRKAVKSKVILLNAVDIEKYCRSEYYEQSRCCQPTNESSSEENGEIRKDPHIQRIVFEHPNPIPKPKNEVLRGIEGSRDHMHVVRNTGVLGVVQYRLFDCCCYGCITHSGNCSQESHADSWITKCLKGALTKVNEVNVDNWFKPIVDTSTPNDVEQFETFDEVSETNERHEDEVMDEDVNEYESCEDLQQPDPVFLSDEQEDPVVNFSDNEDCEDFESSLKAGKKSHNKDSDEDCIITGIEEYTSSEFSEDDTDPEYESDVDVLDADVLDAEDSSTNFDWLSIIKDMAVLRSYEDLKLYVLRTTIPPNEEPIKIHFDEFRDKVDDTAKGFLPRDAPNGYYPVKTGSDGNCGPRALANALLRDEDRYQEVRVRITFVAVLKEELFLNNNMLTRGRDPDDGLSARYALYSGELTPEIRFLSSKAIQTVYRRDVFANRLNGNYIGVWQFHHAAEAFQRPIGTVYPRKTNRQVRNDLNRIVLPARSGNDLKRPAYIMWTPMREEDKNSNVKHFVPLFKRVNKFFLECFIERNVQPFLVWNVTLTYILQQ